MPGACSPGRIEPFLTLEGRREEERSGLGDVGEGAARITRGECSCGPGREEEGGTHWEIRTDIHALPCVEQIASGNLS